MVLQEPLNLVLFFFHTLTPSSHSNERQLTHIHVKPLTYTTGITDSHAYKVSCMYVCVNLYATCCLCVHVRVDFMSICASDYSSICMISEVCV